MNGCRMASIEELRRTIEALDPDQRDDFLAWVLHVSSPMKLSAWMTGIESTPGVCGGESRIARTRIPVWILERMRQLGMNESDILTSYPTLRAEDLVAAWAYVDRHRTEIAEQIEANEEA
jgi:uncharacterized protein (DUF433 family)